MSIENVIILGSGPAGYSASIYAARAALNPVLITGSQVGGQLTTTTDVENWPGINNINGTSLIENMKNHALSLGVNIIQDHINKVDFLGNPFILEGNENIYRASSVIIATGSSAKYLGIKSETKFKGLGISACATCDGFFYRNKDVCVIGGGNTAIEEALYLSNICNKVYLIHRRNEFRGEKILHDKLLTQVNKKKIELITPYNVEEFIGDSNGLTGVSVRNVIDNSLKYIDIYGAFIAIGHTPNTSLFINQLDLVDGYIKINSGLNGNFTATNIPGIFAAGDVTDQIYRQAIISAGSGCMAALDVEKYLSNFK